MQETSALTLHTGKDPKESSGERNETICWTEVQFYSPFDMIFFFCDEDLTQLCPALGSKTKHNWYRNDFFFHFFFAAAAAVFCCFERVLNTHKCVEIQFL